LGILDRIFRKTNKDLDKIVSSSVRAAIKGLSGGKQTKMKWEEQFHWYDQLLTRSDYRAKNVMENLKVIRDLNPDASMAIWNFLRLANTGHELECETDSGASDKRNLELLEGLSKRVGSLYGGGLDQLINVLLLTGFTQGAVALEVEVTDDLKDIVDFHAVDPSTLDYRRNKETGELELVQEQWDGSFKVLNQEQVFYHGFDPDIGDPYGRSPILPILQVIFFQIEVLKDLKKVVHHQGYQRFDISVVEEAIMNNMPDGIKHGSPEEVNAYVQSYISDVQAQMAELEPDDDFFHTDSIKVETAGGSQGNNLDVSRVIDVINQQIVTALKQLPILLGRNEGTTETHGTIQWQIYVAGIESIQRGIKRLLEKAYNISLQVYGSQSKAKITFNPLRVQDRLKEAQAEEVETRVKIQQINQGWIDNDEAAIEIVGHEAVDEPKQPLMQQQPQQQEEEQPDDNPKDEDPEEERKVQKLPRKKPLAHGSRADDFIKEIKEPWADDIARFTTKTIDDIHDFLQRQLDKYIIRLRNQPKVPTRILMDIQSLKRMCKRDETPDPSAEFVNWVEDKITYDSEEQMDMFADFGLEFTSIAAEIAGMEVLLELDSDQTFNKTDEALIRSLRDRANRSAELIQGVTDEDVLMTLWDVVFEGKYSIVKASEALQDSYAFSQNRSKVIARTEILGAARTGQFHGDVQSGMVIGKKWRAARQERTRRGHRAADGQTVEIMDAFSVANGSGQLEMLMFPSDTSLGASASNVIQCRCWYERIYEGEEDLLKG
jgi:hypothetical protein